LWEGVAGEYPAAAERLKLTEVIRRIIDYLASSLIENTRNVLAEKKISSIEDVRNCQVRLVGMDPETARANQELKEFLQQNLYNHEKFVAGREKAQLIIRELFQFYLENPDKLSTSLQERIKSQGLPRMVCDYIAGMTDSYAKSKAREI